MKENQIPKIFIIDYDNTLFHQRRYPDISSVRLGNKLVHAYVRRKKRQGWYIILNTARNGEALEIAKRNIERYGIPYDLVNDNHPLLNEKYGETRKVSGTRTLDDMQVGFIGWLLRRFC